MAQLGDIDIADLKQRASLARRALFYLPSAWPRLCDAAGLKPAALIRLSASLKDQSVPGLAGKEAIERVLNCEVPVAYESALGFVRVANVALDNVNANRGQASLPLFVEADIVSCVFRFRDITTVTNLLGLSRESIAAATGVHVDIVKAAVRDERYRLSLVHALTIWAALRERRQSGERRFAPGEEAELAALTDDPFDLIATDDKYNVAIRKVGGRRAEDEDRYVYGRGDLIPAPETGHPWARSRPGGDTASGAIRNASLT